MVRVYRPSTINLRPLLPPLPMSLYRKYRPQTFEDVVGQDHVAQTLRNALSAEPLRIAHAYLFCGPRGTGKTTTARLLAKCLNCEQGPTNTPCNQCDFCTRVANNQPTMDLIEMDAASNRKIDDAREIIASVNVAPAQGKYRVYIIDEVHMLTTEAFNALLKTLEEPPLHAIFVLATTDAHKVPTTISSRCQHFNFRRVGPRDIVGRLQFVAQSEGMTLAPEAARLIAHTADGALRDALTLLEQVSAFSDAIEESDVRLVLGTVSQELLDGLIGAVAQRDAATVLGLIERALEEGASFSQLARDLVSYCRDLLLLTVGYESSNALSDEAKKTRHDYSKQLGHTRILGTIELLRAAEKETRENTNHRLLLELALVRAASDQFNLAMPTVVPSTPAANAPVTSLPRAVPQTPRPPATSTPVPHEAPSSADRPQPAWRQPEESSASNNQSDADVESLASSLQSPASSRKKGRRIHSMEEFVELWPAVLMRVRKKIGITAVAYLHDATPYELTEKEAVLEFQKEFHYEKACEAAKQHPFEQVLNECLDLPRKLSFRLAERAPEPEPVAETAPLATDEDDEDDVFAVAQQLFAGEVVSRSSSG
jgi:DNA polymerase-3 subunit gamma/tau